MHRPVTAVMLAGRIRPSPLRAALDVHVLCLPVGPRGSLLDAWLDALGSVPGLSEVQVVVNTPADVESVTAISGLARRGGTGLPMVRVVVEPAAWRGAGGILRDVTGTAPEDALVLVCESKRLPPASLLPLLAPFQDAALTGVVGVCGEDEPAGVYAFSRRALALIPSVGYCDMKEQLLPLLARHDERIVTARLCDQVRRLHDLDDYLEAARHSLQHGSNGQRAIRVSDRASVSGSAVLDGCCIIEPGAVVEDGAVVHDSIVLWGATVGGGAIVSRSVLGPLASVEPRSRVVRSFVTRPVRGGSARVVDGARSEVNENSAW